MNIYLIRHGDAVESGGYVSSDEHRYLTKEGRKKTAEVAKKLKSMGISFDLILTSPLVRAIQTAEITASVLNYNNLVISVTELMNGSPFNKFINLLKRNAEYLNVACFGHNPDLTMYLKNMLHMVSVLPVYELKKNSVCAVDYDLELSKSSLIWMLDPKELKITKPSS